MWRVFVAAVLSFYLSSVQAECTRHYRTIALSTAISDVSAVFLQRVMTEAHCQLIFVPYGLTNQRRLRLIADGEIDVVAEASRLPEREEYAWFSLPYRDEKTFLLGRRDDAAITNVRHVNDVARLQLRILAPDGGWFGPELQRERQTWRDLKLMVPFRDPASGMRDLRLGRANLLVATDALNQQQLAAQLDLYVLPFIVHTEAVYLMFSKRTVSIQDVELINKALQKVKL